jgi:hypothetical protein
VDPHKVVIKRSAFSAFPSAQDENENKRWKKPLKREKKKGPKVKLIFSHINHNFLILDLGIEPQTFRHIHSKKRYFLECEERSNVKKSPMQGSISFKLVPRLLVPRPLSKVGLSLCPFPQKQSSDS